MTHGQIIANIPVHEVQKQLQQPGTHGLSSSQADRCVQGTSERITGTCYNSPTPMPHLWGLRLPPVLVLLLKQVGRHHALALDVHLTTAVPPGRATARVGGAEGGGTGH